MRGPHHREGVIRAEALTCHTVTAIWGIASFMEEAMQAETIGRDRIVDFIGSLVGVAVVAIVIESQGGLPHQLVHLYYIPIVVAALLLPTRLSLSVAIVAAAAVSPLPDVFHRALGLELYYPDPAPWNWIVGPIAFIGVSIIAGRLVKERMARASAEATSVSRREELDVLAHIDKMILGGSPEKESIREITRVVEAFTGAKLAGIVLVGSESERFQIFYSHTIDAEASRLVEGGLALGEGVAGWVLMHGTTATSRNVLLDPRYAKMADFARLTGYVSAAAVPLVLDEEVLGALVVSYEQEHNFSPNELATLQHIADQSAIAVANARQRESLQRLAYESAIVLADAIESRDSYADNHCPRLAEHAALTATALGLSGKEVEKIRLGAAVHDAGNIVVPDQVLKKPGKLTSDELAIIKQHCHAGAQICKRVSFLEAVYPIVYHHHERFDGHGYPDGIAGERIPLGARIVAVVDAYDAMTSDRPYRKAMSQEEAEAILRDGAGSQWDPRIVEKFLSALQRSTRECPVIAGS